MSYGDEKRIIDEKMRKIKTWALFGAFLLAACICIFSLFVPADTWKYYVNLPNVSNRRAGELRMHFLNVGQGDCSIIELPDGKVMLVDGGNGSEKTSATILRYLNALKIKKIDYMLVTHADSDHCGGLDKVVRQKEIGVAYLPKVSENSNAQFAELYAALLDNDCPMKYAQREIRLNSSVEKYPYNISFLYPYTSDIQDLQKTETEANALSAVFWLDYFGTSALFTGDAPMKIEEKLMRDSDLGLFEFRDVELWSTEILKVAHHGSKYSTSTEFLRYLDVETATISCAKVNMYDHPSDEVCQRLKEENIDEYRTYEGHIVITAKPDGSYKVKTIRS